MFLKKTLVLKMCRGRVSEVAKTVIELAKKQPGFARNIEKVNIYSCENGNLKAKLTVHESMTKFNGTLHEAFGCFLLDNLTVAALLTHSKSKHLGISVSLYIEFFKSAEIGQSLHVEALTIKVENNLGFAEMKINDEKTGDLLIKGTHTVIVG